MRKTERTARKRHVCDFCQADIAIGERYIDGFHIYDGDPCPWQAHLDCQVLADWMANESGEPGVPPFSDWEPDDDFALVPEKRIEFDRLVARAAAAT